MRHHCLIRNSIRPSTRNAILEAAFILFAQRNDVSLADIAQKAGVGRATLHRHFSGRDDLIRALSIAALKEMDAAVETACAAASTAAQALRLSLETLIPLGNRYRFLLQEPAGDNEEVRRLMQAQALETRALLQDAQSEGALPRSVPPDWLARAYDALLIAAWEAVNAQELTPAQAAGLAWAQLTFNTEDQS